jgi:hypothetical protein
VERYAIDTGATGRPVRTAPLRPLGLGITERHHVAARVLQVPRRALSWEILPQPTMARRTRPIGDG